MVPGNGVAHKPRVAYGSVGAGYILAPNVAIAMSLPSGEEQRHHESSLVILKDQFNLHILALTTNQLQYPQKLHLLGNLGRSDVSPPKKKLLKALKMVILRSSDRGSLCSLVVVVVP